MTAAALAFSWRRRRDGDVEIRHHGRLATTLRGDAAAALAAAMERAGDEQARQLRMARVTGNHKRGNERAAAVHPRNRR